MIMLGGSIMIIGTAILTSSFGVAQFIVGRIVTGIVLNLFQTAIQTKLIYRRETA
jgi:TM2 domain-containing membrane protein YozV